MSDRSGALLTYRPRCSSRKSISISSGRGSNGRVATLVSVVPTSTRSPQGIAKRTRPSSVLGTMMAVSPARKQRSSTT